MMIRRGGPDDLDWLLGLFDHAVAWMVARGQPEQWGDEPWSATSQGRGRARGLANGGGLRVARIDGEDVAALAVGERPGYVPAIDRTELYVQLLLVSRRHAGRRIGERLVRAAIDEARALRRELLRVDCWAGAPTLVAWYERQGFARSGTYQVNDGWTGQIFTMEAAPR